MVFFISDLLSSTYSVEIKIEFRGLYIDNKAAKLFQEYGVGLTTRGAKGVLFLIDPIGKQVRIEIGYDLKPIFADGFTGYIEKRLMTPFFQANKVGPGIESTIEFLVGKALGKIETSNYARQENNRITGRFLSGGGGSRSGMEIGSKSIEKEASPLAKRYQASHRRLFPKGGAAGDGCWIMLQ